MDDPLEPAQAKLLAVLVNAWRSMPDDRRHPFTVFPAIPEGSPLAISHGGLKAGLSVQRFDLEALGKARFIRFGDAWELWGAVTQFDFVVTKAGLDYHDLGSSTTGGEKERIVESPTQSASGATRDPKRVFVVYGRNAAAHRAIKLFLRSLGLQPWDFDQVRNEKGGSPYIGEIVRYGLERAQAVLVLFTPDEWAALHPNLVNQGDKEAERYRWQPRPNVLFEAGMALGIDEQRTILVSLGDTHTASDLTGRYFIRLSNDPTRRSQLRNALIAAGCDVDRGIGDMNDPRLAGDFDASLKPPALPEVSISPPFRDVTRTGGLPSPSPDAEPPVAGRTAAAGRDATVLSAVASILSIFDTLIDQGEQFHSPASEPMTRSAVATRRGDAIYVDSAQYPTTVVTVDDLQRLDQKSQQYIKAIELSMDQQFHRWTELYPKRNASVDPLANAAVTDQLRAIALSICEDLDKVLGFLVNQLNINLYDHYNPERHICMQVSGSISTP